MQRAVLELILDGFDTEAVSYRRENLHIFNGFIPALLLGHTVHRAHIVESVRELYHHYSEVVGHSQKHFADILSLLLLPCGVRDL